MPSPEQKKRIKIQFEVMSVPHYLVRVDYSRGAKHGENKWQKSHSLKREQENTITTPLNTDG